MHKFLHTLWRDQRGQDIAEYAVMLAVILLLVIGTIRLVGSNANNAVIRHNAKRTAKVLAQEVTDPQMWSAAGRGSFSCG